MKPDHSRYHAGPPVASSAIAPGLIEAYETARYHVIGPPRFELILGRASTELKVLYRSEGTHGAAWITACNPASEHLAVCANRRRQADLISDLDRLGLPWLPACGTDAQGRWPAEPACLALRISLNAARDLARKYGQNAILWCAADAIPKLVLLR